MSPVTIGLLLVVVCALGALLMWSDHDKPAPTREALRKFAERSDGAYRRTAVGFGAVVELRVQGWPLVFEVANTLGGPGDSIASYRSFRASGVFRAATPFELTLEPRSVPASGQAAGGGATEALLGIPEINAAYRVRTTDAQIGARLLGDPALRQRLAQASQRASRVTIGPHDGAVWVAFGEDETQLTPERLMSIRDLLVSLLDAAVAQQLALPPQ